MRYVKRRADLLPTQLQKANQDFLNRVEDFFSQEKEIQSQSRGPNANERILSSEAVLSALNKQFSGKCAFCESISESLPFRFRPPSNARPEDISKQPHLYYSWLALVWDNIYTICAECMPHEHSYFPVSKKRQSLPTPREIQLLAVEGILGVYPNAHQEEEILIDPCKNVDFSSHFSPTLSGYLEGKNPQAIETIDYFQLNRNSLIEKRRFHYKNTIETLRHSFLVKSISNHTDLNEIFDFETTEFSGTRRLLLQTIITAMSGEFPPSEMRNVSDAIYREVETRDGEIRFNDILTRMEISAEFPNSDNLESGHAHDLSSTVPFASGFRSWPKIRTIELSNFKAIEKLSLSMRKEANTTKDTKTPALMILGENASGKSTVLEGITLALCTESTREALKLEPSDVCLNPSLLGLNESQNIRNGFIEIEFENDLKLSLTFDRQGMRCNLNEDTAPIFAYGAFRQYGRKRVNYSRHNQVRTLFESDRLLPNPEKWLLRLNRYQFDMVVRALRSIFTIQGKFDVIERTEDRCFWFLIPMV